MSSKLIADAKTILGAWAGKHNLSYIHLQVTIIATCIYGLHIGCSYLILITDMDCSLVGSRGEGIEFTCVCDRSININSCSKTNCYTQYSVYILLSSMKNQML